MRGLRAGQLAERAAVNVQPLRYYERQGLLAQPPRNAANYRVYPSDAPQRVRFIKRAQELGFTLEEIKELLSLQAVAHTSCEAVRERALAKVHDIDEKLSLLQAMRRALTGLIGECSGTGPVTECPILEALQTDGDHAND